MKINQTTSIEYDLKKQAQDVSLNYSDCLEFGIQFKLAEMGVLEDYPKNQLSNKIEKLSKMLEEAYNKIEDLEKVEEVEEVEKDKPTEEEINEEIKGVFGDYGERE